MNRLASALLFAALLAPGLPAVGETDDHAHGSDPSFSSRPDGHAPIGVMGEHMHAAGEWMLSYRYMRMRMDGTRDKDDEESSKDVFARGFGVNPTDMDTGVHMVGLMFAPTDWLTASVMVPFFEKSMDHLNAMGVRFTTKSDGVGDVKLMGLWRIWENETHHFHLNTGVSFPTGELRETDRVPTPGGVVRQQLPYPMQIGSGTWDFVPGLTYVGHSDAWSWGAQALGTVRTGDNKNKYRLGNQVDATAWLAKPWADWISTSVRVQWLTWGNIDGQDPRLRMAKTIVPTADPNRRGGSRLDLLAGVNLNLPLPALGRHRFAVEAGFPAWQYLDGPQLESDWRVTVGWQKSFSSLWSK